MQYMSIFIPYSTPMNQTTPHLSSTNTNSVEAPQTDNKQEAVSKKAANDLSDVLSGHASPLGTKTPAELKKIEAPRSFSKQRTMEEMLKKYEGNSDYIIIYGYYQGFPKYAFKQPFVDERILRISTAQQAEEKKNANKPVKSARQTLPEESKLDASSPYYPMTHGRKVPRKPSLDQLDGNWN